MGQVTPDDFYHDGGGSSGSITRQTPTYVPSINWTNPNLEGYKIRLKTTYVIYTKDSRQS
jgi:hypothetical protein